MRPSSGNSYGNVIQRIGFCSGRALSLGVAFYLCASGAIAATLTLNTSEPSSDIEAEYGGAIQAQRLTGKYANCTLLYEGGIERGDLQKFHALYGYDGENYHIGLPVGAT